MKSYYEYLIKEYGTKGANKILSKQYIFDNKTTQAIKNYKPKSRVWALGHNQQLIQKYGQ